MPFIIPNKQYIDDDGTLLLRFITMTKRFKKNNLYLKNLRALQSSFYRKL